MLPLRSRSIWPNSASPWLVQPCIASLAFLSAAAASCSTRLLRSSTNERPSESFGPSGVKGTSKAERPTDFANSVVRSNPCVSLLSDTRILRISRNPWGARPGGCSPWANRANRSDTPSSCRRIARPSTPPTTTASESQTTSTINHQARRLTKAGSVFGGGNSTAR